MNSDNVDGLGKKSHMSILPGIHGYRLMGIGGLDYFGTIGHDSLICFPAD